MVSKTGSAMKKFPDISVVLFGLFGLFWLTLAAAAWSGAPLTPGTGSVNLFQGLFAVTACLVLAARLELAPKVAFVCSVGILFCPLVGPFFQGGQGTRSHGSFVSSADTVRQRLAAQLALPWPMREKWALLASRELRAIGYTEAPSVRAELQARSDALVEWMRLHPTEARELQSAVDLRSPGYSPERMQADLRKALAGAGYLWLDKFLTLAKEMGAPTEATVPDEAQKSEAEKYALVWLNAHPEYIEALRSGGPAHTGDAMPTTRSADAQAVDPVEDPLRWRHSVAVAGGNFWILALALGAVWKSLAAFSRPWQPAQVPGWIREGLHRLVRSWRLVFAGTALFAVGVAGLVLYFVTPSMIVRRLSVFCMLAGASVFLSGLTLTDEDTAEE